MKRSGKDVAYLSQVLQSWRAAFDEAEGDNMPALYDAAVGRGREDDWSQLRPLLLVLRTMLRINTTFAGAIAYGLAQSIETTADAQTVEELRELQRALQDALKPLQNVLRATDPDPGVPDGPGAGRPSKPGHVIDPEQGGLRGLVDVATMAGVGAVTGAGFAVASVAEASRAWWRATRRPGDGGRET